MLGAHAAKAVTNPFVMAHILNCKMVGKIGDKAPDFALINQLGFNTKLYNVLSKEHV